MPRTLPRGYYWSMTSTYDPPLSECMTLAQIARELGLSDQALYDLRRRYRSFPEPLRRFDKADVYWEPEVAGWYWETIREKALSRQS